MPALFQRHTPQRLPGSTDGRAEMRVLAGYLVLILLLQLFAGAMARGAGPLHQHRPGRTPSLASALFSHDQHARAHAEGLRHWHGAGDETVSAEPAGEVNLAACALVAAMALLACAALANLRAAIGRPLWRAHEPWTASTSSHAPPLRPPRHLAI